MEKRIGMSLTLALLFLLPAPSFSPAADAWAPGERGPSIPDVTFRNPQPVEIAGLPEGAGGTPMSTEEPFVSRDGRFLFFNTSHQEGNKDLHFAERVGRRWVYRSALGPVVNSEKEVEGNPTMDGENTFYYIDTKVGPMVSRALFLPVEGELRDPAAFLGVPDRKVRLFAQRFTGNMGVEVTADGNTLFFSRATWKLRGLKPGRIVASDLLLSTRQGGRFVYDEASARAVMERINTGDLEYAASISADGRELFFTRLPADYFDAGSLRSKIMRSVRPSLSDPFGPPEVVEAIGGEDFVEGPALSADGRELYYHRKVGDKFRLYKVTR